MSYNNYFVELDYLLFKHIFPNFESFRLAIIGDAPLTGDEEKVYDTIILQYEYINVAYATGQELINNMKLDWEEKFAAYIDIIDNNDYKTINDKSVEKENTKKGFATIQIENGEDTTDPNTKLTEKDITKSNDSILNKSNITSINRIAIQNLFGEYFTGLDIRDFPYCQEEE